MVCELCTKRPSREGSNLCRNCEHIALRIVPHHKDSVSVSAPFEKMHRVSRRNRRQHRKGGR
jgi:hypothetical protein